MYEKKATSPTKNEVLGQKTKIVLHLVNFEFAYLNPQLAQILKPTRILFNSHKYNM